jgi:Flp pilus assembly protein CpaB
MFAVAGRFCFTFFNTYHNDVLEREGSMVRRWIVTIVGLLLMAGSVWGYNAYIGQVKHKVETVQALQPARLIASGETINSSMLRAVTIPKEALQTDAIQEAKRIIGQTTVVPIGPDEQIASWKLADRRMTPRKGERYVSFTTDEVRNVGNMLRKGDRVDVWVEFTNPTRLGTQTIGALKVIENLPVASIRTAEGVEIADGVAYDAAFLSTSKQREQVRSHANGKPSINTFIMNDALYEAYVFANLNGQIKLSLPDLSLPLMSEARVTAAFKTFRAGGGAP